MHLTLHKILFFCKQCNKKRFFFTPSLVRQYQKCILMPFCFLNTFLFCVLYHFFCVLYVICFISKKIQMRFELSILYFQAIFHFDLASNQSLLSGQAPERHLGYTRRNLKTLRLHEKQSSLPLHSLEILINCYDSH